MPFCSNCGTEIQNVFEFCPECGSQIRTASEKSVSCDKFKACKKCGAQMPEDAFYCLCCGTTFADDELSFDDLKSRVADIGKPPKKAIDTSTGIWRNKWIALVLCIFFGVFGIHRFYEGKKITGFIYLFSFGILGFGVFFDIVLLITKPNPYRVK